MSDQSQPARPLPRPSNFTRPFWDAAREKKLVIQYCPDSGRYQFYPRPNSLYTGKRNLEWRPVSGKGTVYTYTVTRRAPPGFRGTEPYVVATIELDEGVRMMARLVNCPIDEVEIGMPVRVVWEALDENINYPQFEPDR
jgi:uncharacterized OB-fold protein